VKFVALLKKAVAQKRIYGNEPLEDLDLPSTFDELWAIRSEMKDVIAGARALMVEVDDQIALLVDDGVARMGDSIVTVHQPMKRRVIRPAQFWGFVEATFNKKDISRLFNPNQIRVGELKKLIQERDLDYDVVMDTLFDESRETPTLTVRPSHLAPKWQRNLPEGKITRRNQ